MKAFKTNDDLLNQEYKRSNRETDDTNTQKQEIPMFYLKPGTSQVRILPPYSEKGVWFREVREHFIRGENDNIMLTCPSTNGEPCPICTYGQALYESGNPEDMEFASQLRPRTQYFYNVIVEGAPTGVKIDPNKVYVMKSGTTVKRELLDLDRDVAGGFSDITNLENGVPVMIKRTGTGLNTKYFVRPTPRGRTSLVKELAERGVDINSLQLYNLDEIFPPPSEEQLKEIVESGFRRRSRSSMFPGAVTTPNLKAAPIAPESNDNAVEAVLSGADEGPSVVIEDEVEDV